MHADLIIICVIAAILSIDVRTIGGTMISRPLVVAPLTGLFMKDIRTGFLVAYFVELVWVGMLPVGAYLPVEALPVTVVATYLASLYTAKLGTFSEAVIMFCIIVSVPVGFMSRWLESHIRELNSKLSDYLEDEVQAERIPAVELVTYLNIAVTFIKGFLVCFVPIYLGSTVLFRIYKSLPQNVHQALETSFYIVPLVGLAVVIEIFFVKKYTLHFALSFLLVFVFSLLVNISPFLVMAASIVAALAILYFARDKRTLNV